MNTLYFAIANWEPNCNGKLVTRLHSSRFSRYIRYSVPGQNDLIRWESNRNGEKMSGSFSEYRRRSNGKATATKCSICKDMDFEGKIILGLLASICKSCGHIDFFVGDLDANTDRSNSAIPPR